MTDEENLMIRERMYTIIHLVHNLNDTVLNVDGPLKLSKRLSKISNSLMNWRSRLENPTLIERPDMPNMPDPTDPNA